MQLFSRTALIAGAIVLLAPATKAQTFLANLSGSAESPANASTGTGFATVTLNSVLNTMRVQVTFTGLVGTTTASHIHSATATPFTGTAGVATTLPTFAGFPLGVTSGSYDQTLDMTDLTSYNPTFVTANGGTAAKAQAALFSGITSGQAYLNIHTTQFPSGEIRGFLTAAPEPGALALIGSLGIVGLPILAARRRGRAA
jgi:hypothetical protein